MTMMNTYKLVADGRLIEGVTLSVFPTDEEVTNHDHAVKHFEMTGNGNVTPLPEMVRRRINRKGEMLGTLRVTAVPCN